MKLMILASALALSAPAFAKNDARYDVQLTAFELVVTFDNIAEEAAGLADLTARRNQNDDAKACSNLASSAEALADKIDRHILSPLERRATLAYAKAQLLRLQADFNLVTEDAAGVVRKSRYLDAELQHAATLQRQLRDILAYPDRDGSARNAFVSH